MYQPAVFFIGLRYILGRKSGSFCKIISWLTMIGITLSVIALVTVLSVMNGFERLLQNNILGLMPQALLLSTKGSLNPQQLPENTVKLIEGVTHATLLTVSDVILLGASGVSVGLMLGIDPLQNDPLTPYLTNVKQTDLSIGKYNVILGKQLAEQLGVTNGDQLRIIVPYVRQFTPLGCLPHQRLFNVIGTFKTNSEVDNYQILVNIEDASRLMHYSLGNITGWRLWLKEPLKVDKLSQQKLPDGIKWHDWRERQGDLFQAIHMEKNIMSLFISLIVIVAAFNMLTSLSLMVTEKRCEIAILQIQGLTPYQIMVLFMIQGASAGIIGAVLGAVTGICFASQLNSSLAPIISIVLDKASLPVAIDLFQVIEIMIFVIFIALLFTLYPSWRAAMIKSVEVLRYE